MAKLGGQQRQPLLDIDALPIPVDQGVDGEAVSQIVQPRGAAVLPGMREAGSGRILTVTSVGGAVGAPFADAYCGAKFAVEGFMQSLAPVAARFGVWVSVIEPAAVASDFVGNVSRQDTTGPYADLLQAYLARASGAFASAQSAADAGAVIAEASSAADYRFRWQTSHAARAFVGLSLADLDGTSVLSQTTT